MEEAPRFSDDLNTTSTPIYPYQGHWASQPLSVQEAEVSQQYDIGNDRPHSPNVIPRKPTSSQTHSAGSQDGSTQDDRPLYSSIAPQVISSQPPGGLEFVKQYSEQKERPQSPAVIDEATSPGLQSIWSGEADKEVYRSGAVPTTSNGPVGTPMKKRICGMRRKWFFLIAALITCIIIAVAVPVGVVYGTRNSLSKAPAAATSSTVPAPSPAPSSPPANTGDPRYDIGGALNPLYYSTEGAFNGSGIALATATPGESGYGLVNLYFQHCDGTIRWIQLAQNGSWQGGALSEVIAYNAKNGTPIAVVAYAVNRTATWHLFYIDNTTQVRQLTQNNVSEIGFWEPGPLDNLNIAANNKPMVGLQACWFGNIYGDTDYSSNPQFSSLNVSTNPGAASGMHLFVGVNDTSFQQYGWVQGEAGWTVQEQWPDMNAQAGVGCYSWGPGTVSYVFMLDLEDNLNIFWKDTNASLPGNSTHPINKWTNSSISIPNLHPSSSLGYTNYLYLQLADNSIHGYNISFDAENTAFVPGDYFEIETPAPQLGVPGTHLSVTTSTDSSGGADLLAFYQTAGNDITEFLRDKEAGQWTEAQVPIPLNP